MNNFFATRTKKNIAGVFLAFFTNLFLGVLKIVFGMLFGYISITADAVNNFFDAVNNGVAFFSAKVAEKPADKEHPFGHERMEYVASTVVGIVVVILALQLAIDSIKKIVSSFIQPSLPKYDIAIVIAMASSIVVKLFMAVMFRRSGKKYNLPLHAAMAVDSFNDVISSTIILASILCGHYFGVALDGYVGFVVSVIIFISGVNVLKSTLNPLLGIASSDEETQKIIDIVNGFEGVLGVHDIVIHQYGPIKRFVTLHVEIDALLPVLDAHELADTIERLFREDGVEMLVHLDPIVTDDQYTNELKQKVTDSLSVLSDFVDLHDFRVVYGKKNRVLFDVTLNFGSKLTVEHIVDKLKAEVSFEEEYCISIDYK